MPTWTETKDYLRKTLTLVADEPEWVGLGWSHTGPNNADVIQKQRVELVQAFGEPHVLIWSDIIETDRVPPRIALTHNMTLAIGGIAIYDNLYVLRAVLPLAHLDFDYLHKTMSYIGHEAARLRITTPPKPEPAAG